MKAILKTIYLLSVLVAVTLLFSCKETVYGHVEPISWRIVSVSDDNAIQATVNKSVANVACGLSGGVVVLKTSAVNMVMYTEPDEGSYLEKDEYDRGISYRNDWCEVTREVMSDGTLFRIVFHEYKAEKELEVHLELSDYQYSFACGDLYIRRMP